MQPSSHRLISAAREFNGLAVHHKREAARHRRRAIEYRERQAEIERKCAEIGIEIVYETGEEKEKSHGRISPKTIHTH